MANHPITHVEFSAKNRKESQKFYGDVFGWEFTVIDEMRYTTFRTGGEVGGGLNEITEGSPAGTVTVYIATDDVSASLDKVVAAGGSILVPATEIPGTGWFGMFRDPAGNQVGLFKWITPPAR